MHSKSTWGETEGFVIREVIEVSVIDPVASMMAIKNDQLGKIAMEVQAKMKKVCDSL